MPEFQFYGFTLRSTRQEDLLLSKQWMLADPYHREACKGLEYVGEFWLRQRADVESYFIADRWGPLAFLQLHTATQDIRLFCQFCPDGETAFSRAEQRCRRRTGLLQLVPLIEKALTLRGMKALFFISKSPEVIRFMEKRLQFRPVPTVDCSQGVMMRKELA